MTDIDDVHKVYQKTLHIENTHLIDVPLTVYITKDFEGDPLFVIPKGASGCGKTVLTAPLRDLSYNPHEDLAQEKMAEQQQSGFIKQDKNVKKYGIYLVSRMTPATFASGSSPIKEKDLGYHLENKTSLLIFSDMAPLLSMQEETRNELFAMMRDLFDGHVITYTGKESKCYTNIKTNILGFSTDIIERETQLAAQMGTREIVYDLPEIKDIDKAMEKSDTPEGREERSNVVKDFLDDLEHSQGHYKYTGEIKPIRKDMENTIKNFAKLTSKWRTTGVFGDDGLLIQNVKPEYSMRLYSQLTKLYQGLIALGVSEPMAFFHLKSIVENCGHSLRTKIMQQLEVVNPNETEKGFTIEISPSPKSPAWLSNNLNISPIEIIKELVVLRDLGLVKRAKDIEDIGSKRTLWHSIISDEEIEQIKKGIHTWKLWRKY